MGAVVLFAVVVVSLAAGAVSPAAEKAPSCLRDDVRPSRYDLDPSPDLDVGTFLSTVPEEKARAAIALAVLRLAVGGAACLAAVAV